MLHLILNCDPRIDKYKIPMVNAFDDCGTQTECSSTMVHLTG